MTVHCSATLSYHTAAVCAEQVKDGSKTRASGRAQHSVSLQGRCFDEAGLPCFNAELKKQSADSLFSVLTNSLWLRTNSEEPEGPWGVLYCVKPYIFLLLWWREVPCRSLQHCIAFQVVVETQQIACRVAWLTQTCVCHPASWAGGSAWF